MALDEHHKQIIAGCVAGGAVLIIGIIILVCCLCRRKKNASKEDSGNSTTRGIPPGETILPSTLPKVGSNGLWIPSQSMLSATPSSAYTQAKPSSKQPKEILYRATSEPRLLEGPGQGYHGNLRIYHSQQLAPLYEVYEPGRYDRYLESRPSSLPLWEDSRVYHSQSTLLEEGVQMNHVYEQNVEHPRPRVRRSASDVTSSMRLKQGPRSTDITDPYSNKKFTAVVEVHRQLPVRSHWGQNRGPNKERQQGAKSKPISGNGDYIYEHSLARKGELRANQYPRQTATWDPGYRATGSGANTTIYSPEDGKRDSYPRDNQATYPQEENFKLELRTTYSSHESKPPGVDQGVQVGPGVSVIASSSVNNTVSSQNTETEEDGGYFTSSGRTDITSPNDDSFHLPKPDRDNDVASEVTDLESKGDV